ncbi:hypothetical protein K470DRAFT_257301 [Piedraia hortae CBS 480.64]|uniref:Uncharacterized protein n=1 Tax=Piedraia hortae CBS 480.64 TaxID=1314780 RepID=A0A6A7C368_9PEZI|nr:hypothetical protein K470DRAFT_257301 [Piedraia hortae CBS 480.64]
MRPLLKTPLLWAGKRFHSTVNPHRQFYRTFGQPLARNFLIAMATFQVLYITWVKLESIEVKHRKNEEVGRLEEEIGRLRGKL